MEASMTFEPATPASMGPITIHRDVLPDIIGFLPAAAAARLQALRDRCSDLHLLIPEFEERRTAGEARLAAEQRLKRLTDHPQHGGFGLEPEDPRTKDAQRDLDKLTADAKRITDRYEMRAAAWRQAGACLSRVESWLGDGGRPAGTVLQDFSGPEPQLFKGESITDAINRLRHRVRELRADLHRIESAPFPSSHARAKMRQTVEALAMRGAVNVSHLVERDGDIEFPTTRITAMVRNIEQQQAGAVAFVEVSDATAIFAWLHQAELIRRLDEEILSEADDDAALSVEDRQRHAADVATDLLVVERDESVFVWRAQTDRLPVEHRADINPVALLSLKLVTPAAGNRRGTSPEHGYDIVGR
jgi:hypothetical protein